MKTEPTLVMVPCFAGAPWQLDPLTHLQSRAMRTLRLPDDVCELETLADFIADQVKDLESYVLVGDSYGAVSSIAVATRQPKGLKGLVLSGGFAKSPITSPLLKTLAALVPFFPGPFYRQTTLRVHAAQLASSFDKEGDPLVNRKEPRLLRQGDAPQSLRQPHALDREGELYGPAEEDRRSDADPDSRGRQADRRRSRGDPPERHKGFAGSHHAAHRPHVQVLASWRLLSRNQEVSGAGIALSRFTASNDD